MKSSTTIIFGGHTRRFPSEAKSASSIARITKRCWSCACTPNIWDERFADISAFERYLTRNGVVIRKFFLHVSKKEQKRRLLERLEDPNKNWKFSMADVQERGFWKNYQQAYEEMVRRTTTKYSPWYVVPADNKWFTRLVVASAIIETLHGLDLAFPVLDKATKKELNT